MCTLFGTIVRGNIFEFLIFSQLYIGARLFESKLSCLYVLIVQSYLLEESI